MICEATSNLACGQRRLVGARVPGEDIDELGDTHIKRRVVGRLVPVRVDPLDPRAQVRSERIVGLARSDVDAVVDPSVSAAMDGAPTHASTDSIISEYSCSHSSSTFGSDSGRPMRSAMIVLPKCLR